jgi:hypothetical protein
VVLWSDGQMVLQVEIQFFVRDLFDQLFVEFCEILSRGA